MATTASHSADRSQLAPVVMAERSQLVRGGNKATAVAGAMTEQEGSSYGDRLASGLRRLKRRAIAFTQHLRRFLVSPLIAVGGALMTLSIVLCRQMMFSALLANARFELPTSWQVAAGIVVFVLSTISMAVYFCVREFRPIGVALLTTAVIADHLMMTAASSYVYAPLRRASDISGSWYSGTISTTIIVLLASLIGGVSGVSFIALQFGRVKLSHHALMLVMSKLRGEIARLRHQQREVEVRAELQDMVGREAAMSMDMVQMLRPMATSATATATPSLAWSMFKPTGSWTGSALMQSAMEVAAALELCATSATVTTDTVATSAFAGRLKASAGSMFDHSAKSAGVMSKIVARASVSRDVAELSDDNDGEYEGQAASKQFLIATSAQLRAPSPTSPVAVIEGVNSSSAAISTVDRVLHMLAACSHPLAQAAHSAVTVMQRVLEVEPCRRVSRREELFSLALSHMLTPGQLAQAVQQHPLSVESPVAQGSGVGAGATWGETTAAGATSSLISDDLSFGAGSGLAVDSIGGSFVSRATAGAAVGASTRASTTTTTSLAFRPSLQHILQHPVTYELFKDEMVRTHSVENVLFLRHLSAWRSIGRAQPLRRLFASAIGRLFVEIGSPYELNIQASVRSQLQVALASGRESSMKGAFDATERDVMALIMSNSWSTFTRSDVYLVCTIVLLRNAAVLTMLKAEQQTAHDGNGSGVGGASALQQHGSEGSTNNEMSMAGEEIAGGDASAAPSGPAGAAADTIATNKAY